ncbi:tyrosine-type recombinase/integrase [Vibrio tetraodonis]|uniref:tyrosine-type recombinase/integrase n=1 Tax=Vibrio tetraodonis TaxID=2231647 RepID=UPI001F07346A|nr:tyrosine-type recombinase/integrase [Vibrio tetraodonis]
MMGAVNYLGDFERWDFYSPLDHKLYMVEASDTPFITYASGVPCYEANMYMHRLLTHNRTAGTLRTYANQIIHIVKFCHENQIRFSNLTDSSFRLFIQYLQAEKDEFGERARTNNHVINIARRCLDFLVFVQELHEIENFIGQGKENSIIVKITKSKKVIEGSNYKREEEIFSHASFPSKDAVKKKLPVSEDDALKVWNYIQDQENRNKRMRDIALYQCMEQLGARVEELHLITVDDVKNAIGSSVEPHLTLTNLKRKDDNTTRSIPVTSALLTDIKSYINKVRKKVIKSTIGKENDHGYLFISLTTGKRLKSATLTRYMNKWKRDLGIEGELHAHLYRHAFITNKLKEIILQHKEITSVDKFREHLLHTEKFKMQLKEWTGHTRIYSLDIYINLVFSELNGYSEIYNAVKLKDSVTIVQRQVQSLKQQLKDKSITMTEGLLQIDMILSAFEYDIENSLC